MFYEQNLNKYDFSMHPASLSPSPSEASICPPSFRLEEQQNKTLLLEQISLFGPSYENLKPFLEKFLLHAQQFIMSKMQYGMCPFCA